MYPWGCNGGARPSMGSISEGCRLHLDTVFILHGTRMQTPTGQGTSYLATSMSPSSTALGAPLGRGCPRVGSRPLDFVTRSRASYPGPRPVWVAFHGSGGGGRKQPTLVATIRPGYLGTIPDGQLVMQNGGIYKAPLPISCYPHRGMNDTLLGNQQCLISGREGVSRQD